MTCATWGYRLARSPGPGGRAEIGPGDPRIQIPVAFSPPRISVAEAGLLADGQVDVRETTATLIDLAVRGAIGLRTDERHGTFAAARRSLPGDRTP